MLIVHDAFETRTGTDEVALLQGPDVVDVEFTITFEAGCVDPALGADCVLFEGLIGADDPDDAPDGCA